MPQIKVYIPDQTFCIFRVPQNRPWNVSEPHQRFVLTEYINLRNVRYVEVGILGVRDLTSGTSGQPFLNFRAWSQPGDRQNLSCSGMSHD